MHPWIQRIYKYPFFKLAGTETRVKNFFFEEASGLLEAWQGKPSPKTSGDIERGLWNATQSPSENTRSQNGPDSEESRISPEDCLQVTSLASAKPIEPEFSQQPQFTDGPARFVVVNDGTKDCLALLVTDMFVAKSRGLYEDSHHLSGKQGPLQQVRRDARNAEFSLALLQRSFEEAASQEEADELGETAQKRENELVKARQRREEIEKGAELLESSVAASKAYTQRVLETAMAEASLLEPHRPLTPFITGEVEDDETVNKTHNHIQVEDADHESGVQRSVQDADIHQQQQTIITNDAEVRAQVPGNEDSVRQAAWEDYNDKLKTFQKLQAIFDDRQQSYETNLAKSQDGVRAGNYNMSRSDFDRNRVRYGRKVTRALIDAEEAFDAAKAYAEAVRAIGSDYEPTNFYDNYAESMPDSQGASYNASQDFGDIYAWMANVPETGDPNDPGCVKIDEWDVKDIDHTDSISQIDFEEYRKPIDKWQYECAVARGEGPEEYYLGPVNIEFLARRHSVSLCRSHVGQWDVGI